MNTQTQNIIQHDFILLDRSGSMSGMWDEALNSINAYVQKLAETNVDTGVTLAVFDSNEPFTIIRDRITPKTWKNVTNADCSPRGGTPLNDATAKLIQLARTGAPWGQQYGRVAIVIVTDGEENASKEFRDVSLIKRMLDECREKNWQIMYLGADFDNQKQAASYGAATQSTVRTSTANFGSTMRSMASKRFAYANTGASMSYNSMEQTALASATPVSDEELDKLSQQSS